MIMKKYTVIIKPLAEKDLRNLPKNDSVNILKKIISLENSFQGDIKKLTNFTPEYRLRVGNYRILFELEKNNIIVYRILHRKESYN
jgi:mRNA interferase RelE/StbE